MDTEGKVQVVSDQRPVEIADKIELGTVVENVVLHSEYARVAGDDPDAWNQDVTIPSLPEVYGSVAVADSEDSPWWKTMLSYVGPGAMVAVGYMDPGNWSTDIAGGSKFGYTLLFVILVSSMIAMFLQYLAIKCGLATNRDLAQACRDAYPPSVVTVLWLISECAIAATDLAEVIGSAVAMKLLFGLPLIAGVCITAFDVLLLLFMQGKRYRLLELCVGILVCLIATCFAVEMGFSKPEAIPLLTGFIPTADLVKNKELLFIAAGIIGATVMPHNLFLHSSIVLTRKTQRNENALKQAVRYSTIDCNVSLVVAWFVNSAILIVAASTFHTNGYNSVATLEEAASLLNPILGSKAAAVLFGVALLASGQNSTLTGTISGQIVMEGFLNWTIKPIIRRVVTRLVAIVPAVIAILVGGDKSANQLLIISQVTLCFALPFAIFPLVHITSSKSRMSATFVNSLFTTILAYTIGTVLIILNIVVSVS